MADALMCVRLWSMARGYWNDPLVGWDPPMPGWVVHVPPQRTHVTIGEWADPTAEQGSGAWRVSADDALRWTFLFDELTDDERRDFLVAHALNESKND